MSTEFESSKSGESGHEAPQGGGAPEAGEGMRALGPATQRHAPRQEWPYVEEPVLNQGPDSTFDTDAPRSSITDVTSGESGDDTADGDDMDPRIIVTEALAPRLSRKALLSAAGIVLALTAGVGLIAGATGNQSSSVEMTTIGADSGADITPRDTTGIAATAAQSVYRVQAGSQSGSSWLIDSDMLVTNAHVADVDVGESLTITSPAGEEFDGEVLMKDIDMDIAFIEVPSQDADPLPLAGVSEQESGQPVALAGYPLGLDLSVSVGVVSAVDTVTNLRESPAQHSLLQIDAAVNPGSSGGPVLDSRGRVMGMATSRPDSVGGRPVSGVAFAIPSNDINVALQQYEEHGDVRYGYLGVSLETNPDGVVITGVTKGSPADSVGLEDGEAITDVGGYPTETYTQVSRYLHMYRPGDEVKITVESDGDSRAVNVVLGEQAS